VAAGNAKINVIVDGLRQVQALEKSLNNISRLSGKINGGGGGAVPVRIEKTTAQLLEAKRASMIKTRNIGDQIERLSLQGLKVDKARAAIKRASVADSKGLLEVAKAQQESALNTLKTEQFITKEKNRQRQFGSIRGGFGGGGGGGIIRGNKFDNRSNSAALRSGLISGAFPLLFGQGLLGGAAGFAGGAIGTKLGGQMGGFAGGLVATAALQGVINFRDRVTELGKALSPANDNINDSIEKLKIISTTRAAEIRLIEQSKGSAAALAAITKETAKVIGNDGVRALQEFAEAMKVLGASASKLALKIKATLAGAINTVLDTFGDIDLKKAKENLGGTDDPLVKALEDNKKALENLLRDPQPGMNRKPEYPLTFNAPLPLTETGEDLKKRLQADQNILKNSILIKSAKEAGLRFDKEIGVERMKLINTIQTQYDLENKILELQKTGLNPALANQIALIEQAAENDLAKIESQIRAVDELLKIESEAANRDIDKIQSLQITSGALKDQLRINLRNLGVVKENVIEQDKKNKILREQVAIQKEIESILAGGMTNAVMGLIEGSKTLGQVLADVAKQLASMFLNKAFSSIFGGMFGGGGGMSAGGYYSSTTGLGIAGPNFGLAEGGYVNSASLKMIGEGGEPEYVIPASKMSGAMSRYSAGARGGAVIPGGSHESGTVAGSSGNTVVEYTGPTLNFNGDEYVPKSAVPEIIGAAAKRGAQAGKAQVIGSLRNSRSQRASLGL